MTTKNTKTRRKVTSTSDKTVAPEEKIVAPEEKTVSASNTEDNSSEETDSKSGLTSAGKPDRRKGKRARYYACAAISGEKVVMKLIAAESVDEAKKGFKAETKLAALEIIEQQLFQVVKTGSEDEQIQVQINRRDVFRNTEKAFKFMYKGWLCFGSGIKACKDLNGIDWADDELVQLNPGEAVDPERKKFKPRMRIGQVMPINKMENVEQLD